VRARHRRERGDVQRHQRSDAAAAAVPAFRASRLGGRSRSQAWRCGLLVGGVAKLLRLALAFENVRTVVGLPRTCVHDGDRRTSGAHAGRDRLRRHLRGPRRPTGPRSWVPSRGGTRRVRRGRDQRQPLALGREHPDGNGNRVVTRTPELESLVGGTRRPLIVLLAAVGCVLLIACVNLANLLLVRGAARGREIALRLALGASRRRIVVQLLTESVVLSAFGTAAGLLLAAWSIRALVQISPTDVRGLDEVTIDGAVLAFTTAVGFVAALAFGTVPAFLASRTALRVDLEDSGRATAGRRHSR